MIEDTLMHHIDVLPDYLKSYEVLQQHIRAHLNESSTTEKGERFARFVQRLIPQTELGVLFQFPELNSKKSHDGGIDLFAQSRDGDRKLFIQSKLWVDRVETIDSVLSKFQAFTVNDTERQPTLFDTHNETQHFLLITLSPLDGLLEKYQSSHFSSVKFYHQCMKENRIHFIGGYQVLTLLRAAYSKIHQIPTNMVINFDTPFIYKDNVYVGILSNKQIKELYTNFGDALFFENVRDFIGVQESLEDRGRTTPNLEIIKTVKHDPVKLLSRNNGIVFGAEKVKVGENDQQLVLHNGSLVNGCQTTMCVVEYADEPCFVLVKIVETHNAWDVTRAANYQTSVPDIDLELARYLRPQLVKRAATNLGIQIDDFDRSAFQIIDEIYDRRIAYSETRLFYIGLFSRTPNNVFAANYTELMKELIAGIYESGMAEEHIFEVLFSLQRVARKSLEEAKQIFAHPSYSNLFERLYRETSLAYRCFLGILAVCGVVDMDISAREADIAKEVERMKSFLGSVHAVLIDDPIRFEKFHKLTIKIWMQDLLTDDNDTKILRDMNKSSKRMSFTNMFRKLRMEADLDSGL